MKRVALLLVIVGAGVCAWISAGASASPAGTAAAGKFGVGLKLGAVVLTSPIGTANGPWLVWNKSSCSYQVASTHPAAYSDAVRKVSGVAKIGYMNYGDSDPFGIANSKDIAKTAKLAGLQLDVYNLKYPSPTEPIIQAKDAVVKQDLGVIQAQQIASLNPVFLGILQKKGCIPTVQMYLKTPMVPSFGAVWSDVGTTKGLWLGKYALAHKLSTTSTAMVNCTDPGDGESVNVMFTTTVAALNQQFKLPSGNVFNLVCAADDTIHAQTAMTDWLTAHPNFSHIIVTSINDEQMLGMSNALRRSGQLQDTISIASGLDGLGIQLIKTGVEQASVAFFPERYGRWLVPIMEDILAGNPVPSFTGSKLIVVTKQNIATYYPG